MKTRPNKSNLSPSFHLLIVSLEDFQVNLRSNINFSSSFNCREELKQHEECLTADDFVVTNTTAQVGHFARKTISANHE